MFVNVALFGQCVENRSTFENRITRGPARALPRNSAQSRGRDHARRWRACSTLHWTQRLPDRGVVSARYTLPTLVFVLGGPGSGKGTQCRRLAEELNWATVCVGQLLREEATLRRKEPRGAYLEHLLSRGEIVPGHITIELLLDRCAAFSGKSGGILVDGFPRALEQAEAFERAAGASCAFAVYFACSEDVMISRLLERGRTSNRTDDNLETIQRRLITFRHTSMPVIEKYRQLGKLVEINADADVDSVAAAVRREFAIRGFTRNVNVEI
jgi:UMP-CMP kinase